MKDLKDQMMTKKSAPEPAWKTWLRSQRGGDLALGSLPGSDHAEI
jgi:hypothetical protein